MFSLQEWRDLCRATGDEHLCLVAESLVDFLSDLDWGDLEDEDSKRNINIGKDD